MQQPAIKVSGLTVHYQETPVLWDIDFEIPCGKFIGLVGPNGAGKSTLLKAILGLVPAVSGSVWIKGETVEQARLHIAYVPQRGAIDWDFPITVKELVLMGAYPGLGMFKPMTKEVEAKALEALEMVGMQDYASRQISQLSGGEQQRVFLARALMQNADLYILDEPLQGVDHATEEVLIGLLQKLVSQHKTVLMVHHDLATVETYFDWVILLNIRLVGVGPKEIAFTKQNLYQTYGKSFALFDETFKRSKSIASGAK